MFRVLITGAIIIIFFLLHSMNENGGLLKAEYITLFFFISLLVNIFLFFPANIFFRNQFKASVFAFLITTFFLFFGEIQDYLSTLPVLGNYSGMRFFLPFSMLFIIFLFILIARSKDSFIRINHFLLTLGIILSIYELILLVALPEWKKKEMSRPLKIEHGLQIRDCDTCRKPDIYFFLLDEYTGSEALMKDFHFDNSWFEEMLNIRDFKVLKEVRSPYILTIYSMASMLNLEIKTDTARQKIKNNPDYQAALRYIGNNAVCRYLIKNGYDIRNLSPFDLPQSPSSFSSAFNPNGLQLIYYKTIYGRLMRDLPSFLRRKGIDSWDRQFVERIGANNEAALLQTLAPRTSKKPVFTYTHLYMPHYPFRFDSLGNTRNAKAGETEASDCLNYIEYLVYTNKKMIRLIDQLKQQTGNNSVIILASDHGYRLGCGAGPMTSKNSVIMSYFLPAEFSSPQLGPGISNTYNFRILLNAIFHTGLPVPQQKVPAMNDRDVKQTIDKDR